MKKILLLSCLWAAGLVATAQPVASSGPFTEGNLVIYRFNDEATSKGGVVPAFIDEITPEGTLVRSIAMPTAASGTSRRFMGGLFNQLREGLMSLSADGRYLSVMGIDGPRNGTAYATYPKVIGRISGNGEVNTSTTIPTSNIGNVGRAAISKDGSAFYTIGGGNAGTGNDGRVRYVPFGFNADVADAALASAPIVGGANNGFSFDIFNNQLYFAEQTTAGSSQNGTIGTLGAGLPAPSADMDPRETYTSLPLPGLTLPNQFVLFDLNADAVPDLLYVIEVPAAGAASIIYKYTYGEIVPGFGQWNAQGSFTHAKLIDGKGLTAKIVGTDAWIFVCTAPAAGKPSIVRINDPIAGTMGAGYTVTQTVPDFNKSGLVTTILYASLAYHFGNAVDATTGTTVNFRGIAFAPKPFTVTPVKLTSFNAKKQSGSIQLSWSTSLEQNNSHFEVLRSDDGNEFKVIGKVKGNGNSSVMRNYGFVDSQPLNGDSYYQLKQVDYSGESEKSTVISVNFDLKRSDFSAFVNDVNQLQLSVHSEVAVTNAQVRVSDVSGRVMLDAKVQLDKGGNVIKLPVDGFIEGIYVVTLVVNNEAKSIKVIK